MKSSQSRRSTLLQGLALTVCLLTAGAGSALADGLDDVVKAGTIKIGIFEDFPPFASLGSDMKIDGYDVEMADLIAKAIGV
jgi:polar amino acid transport system substrate-binding protein